MGRYDIAKNMVKSPEEQATVQQQPVSINTFGFDADFVETVKKRSVWPYFCPPGTKNRVGIIFNSPDTLFVGAKVHYYNKTFFLCKEGRCCSAERRPQWRMGCALVIVPHDFSTMPPFMWEIVPWVFSRRIYEILKEINMTSPLISNDFILSRISQPFQVWKLQPIFQPSAWQSESSIRGILLQRAQPIINNLKSYVGQDLDDYQIQELLSSPNTSQL